jgi:hypothetical protein
MCPHKQVGDLKMQDSTRAMLDTFPAGQAGWIFDIFAQPGMQADINPDWAVK